jgi:hypothetical protein
MSLRRPRNSRSYFYHAYGISIESVIPLPEFAVNRAEPFRADADVMFGSNADWADSVRHLPSFWSVRTHDARFWFQGVGSFLVSGGSAVIIDPEPGIDAGLLRLYVEGMMMACLLQQRGAYVLHASVVQMIDHAIAFLGHIGAGKSTMAAALHFRGHPVVTDDNAAVDLRPSEPQVVPAFPSIKLLPAIAECLGCDDDSLRVMHASQKKRARSVSRDFPSHPVPLRRIYVLDREAEDAIVRLSAGQAVLELIRNSVPTRWRQPGDSAHLMQCGELSQRVPVWKVRTFDTLDAIPELTRRIEEHALQHLAAVA